MLVLKIIAGVLSLTVVGLAMWRASDVLAASTAWARLAGTAAQDAGVFEPAMVADLPEAARRYFRFAIAPGTPLYSVAAIEMEGQLGLGTKDAPGYRPMRARQILAPPHGLVWRLNAGMISGSDAALPDNSWTRFWLFHLVPVARVGETIDHHLSAGGRVAVEALVWVPTSVLLADDVHFEAIDRDRVRVIFGENDAAQVVEMTVDNEGRATEIIVDRWSDANPEKEYRRQPFGGHLGDYRTFGGVTVPTKVEVGNLFGTEAFFPFFRAKVTSVDFL
ncbi:MAG: hypothetical protein HKM96_12980 [Boseongicola sp.]|nr:hypothetical protein [Boseongicola sp.]